MIDDSRVACPFRAVWPAKTRAAIALLVTIGLALLRPHTGAHLGVTWRNSARPRDPIVDNQGRGSFDTQAAGIKTNTPQINAEIRDCNRVYPASIGIPWAP